MARNASTFCMSTVLITLFDFLYLQLNNNQLSRENVHERFPVKRLKPLGTRWVPVENVY